VIAVFLIQISAAQRQGAPGLSEKTEVRVHAKYEWDFEKKRRKNDRDQTRACEGRTTQIKSKRNPETA